MMLRSLLIGALALVSALSSAPVAAATEARHPHAEKWSFEGPFGKYDRGALQRGFQVYKEVCSSCHSLRLLSYRNLGEKGGPFETVRTKNEQTKAVEFAIGAPGEGKKAVDANESPFVKAIAADYEVTETDPETGDPVKRKARPSDRFVHPFANDGMARAANGGALPPDMSLLVKARENGVNYIHALMLGYDEQPPPGIEPVAGKHWNPYFPGGWISMPKQLTDNRVTYTDGTKATADQEARDIVTFLAWASDPKAEERKATGLQVLVYLVLLSGLLYLAYRQIWKDAH
jgi:ubiquinol-cytochrome c reductase cytochrome c1 subunit